jgi:DNA-binding LacI/PurR family transcriptional regulator
MRHPRPTEVVPLFAPLLAGEPVPLVSLVFRNAPGPSAQTRERVLHAAAELEYRPDTAA